uniref:Crinkler effector protein N-terminal domain-containing protein n=1 Tax=Globisporangium ultimum (strain ATCC 200006 / CBS 805.95 / DAOM BR144) TaxID=431595 RepID=K3WB60_GLOUD
MAARVYPRSVAVQEKQSNQAFGCPTESKQNCVNNLQQNESRTRTKKVEEKSPSSLRLNSSQRRTIATLFCIIVGVGVVFSVNIGLNKTAGDLKHEIKAKKPNHVQFDASLLKLYLASRGDTWLKSRDKNSMLALKKEILQMKYTI